MIFQVLITVRGHVADVADNPVFKILPGPVQMSALSGVRHENGMTITAIYRRNEREKGDKNSKAPRGALFRAGLFISLVRNNRTDFDSMGNV